MPAASRHHLYLAGIAAFAVALALVLAGVLTRVITPFQMMPATLLLIIGMGLWIVRGPAWVRKGEAALPPAVAERSQRIGRRVRNLTIFLLLTKELLERVIFDNGGLPLGGRIAMFVFMSIPIALLMGFMMGRFAEYMNSRRPERAGRPQRLERPECPDRPGGLTT